MEKKKTVRDKANMIALWTTVLGMFGATGIPKIVELLDNKPTITQVNAMVAKQTEHLTIRLNELIDTVNEVRGELQRHRSTLRNLRRKIYRSPTLKPNDAYLSKEPDNRTQDVVIPVQEKAPTFTIEDLD